MVMMNMTIITEAVSDCTESCKASRMASGALAGMMKARAVGTWAACKAVAPAHMPAIRKTQSH